MRQHTTFRSSAGFVAAALTLLGTVGCGSEPAADATMPYAVITEASIDTGAIPDPVGDLVLRVVDMTSDGQTFEFDLAALESIGVIEYAVDDQQAEGDVATFRGVLISDLLDVVGASPDATSLMATALNDYAVEIPVADVRDHAVMLATSVNGERMSVARYGPTRIVYPYHTGEFDRAVYEPRWIWQLATIEIR